MEESIFSDKYMLVSDSNESSSQFDTKKLNWLNLVELAQDNLFKNHLDIMDNYLTKNQIVQQQKILNNRLNALRTAFTSVDADDGSGRKLKVVDGQIILLRADQIPNEEVLVEYLKKYWDITPDYSITQLHDCMLRGVTEVRSTEVLKPGNQNVALTKETMPSHMHHSGITQGANIGTMHGTSSEKSGEVESGTAYDMFYNDSFSTGLSKNEMDGTVDLFSVQPVGDNVAGQNEPPKIMHNNMPVYGRYYVFLITKNSV